MKILRYFFCFPQGGFNDFCEIIWTAFEYCKKFNRTLVIDTRFIITFKDDFRKYIIINDPLVYTGDIDLLFEKLKTDNVSFYPKLSSILSDFKNIYDITSKFSWKKKGIYYDDEIRCSFSLKEDYHENILFFSTVKGGPNITKLLEISELDPTLKNKILLKYNTLPKDYVAIHIRNTDYTSNFRKFQENHKHLLTNKDIFLATDDFKVTDFFKQTYKERLFQFSNIPSVKIRQNRGFHYDNKIILPEIMIEDCISDFILCCLSDKYYYSCKESSFSKNIELVKQNNAKFLSELR